MYAISAKVQGDEGFTSCLLLMKDWVYISAAEYGAEAMVEDEDKEVEEQYTSREQAKANTNKHVVKLGSFPSEAKYSISMRLLGSAFQMPISSLLLTTSCSQTQERADTLPKGLPSHGVANDTHTLDSRDISRRVTTKIITMSLKTARQVSRAYVFDSVVHR